MLRLLEMISAMTPYTVTTENTVIGKPISIPGDYNTQVLLQGSLQIGHYGRSYFKYDRFKLDSLPEVIIYYQNQKSLYSLLDEINSNKLYSYLIKKDNKTFLKSAQLKKEDIHDRVLTDKDKNKTLLAFAKDDSYLFTGTLRFRLQG